MARALTPRQESVLHYMVDITQKRGYPPSIREICDAVGLSSTSTVFKHLESLEDKGYIKRDPTKPRAIEFTEESISPVDRVVRLPLVQTLSDIEAIYQDDDSLNKMPFPFSLTNTEEACIFVVPDESMSLSGIHKDDYIFIRFKDDPINDGFALIDHKGVLKLRKFISRNGTLRFQNHASSGEEVIWMNEVSIIGTPSYLLLKS